MYIPDFISCIRAGGVYCFKRRERLMTVTDENAMARAPYSGLNVITGERIPADRKSVV
jgi:hypothetical protein